MQQLEIKRLGSYLVDAGLISLAQIDVALNDQEFMDNMRLGDILVTRGWIKQQTLDYLIEKVVEPEQRRARQAVLDASMVVRRDPYTTYPGKTTVRQSIPESGASQSTAPQTIAQARALDGTRILEIRKPQTATQPGYPVSNPPTDPGQINDRKPLSSIPSQDDDTNWVG
jgi:hypothetical protein